MRYSLLILLTFVAQVPTFSKQTKGILAGWSAGTGGGDYVFLTESGRFTCSYDKSTTRERFDRASKELIIGEHVIVEFVKPIDGLDGLMCLVTSVRFRGIFNTKVIEASHVARDLMESLYAGRYESGYSLLSGTLRETVSFEDFVSLGRSLRRGVPGWNISIKDLVISRSSQKGIEAVFDPGILRFSSGELGVAIAFEEHKAVIARIRSISKGSFAELFEQ